MDNKERRRRRSNKWGEALYFQLDTCRERSGLVAMVLIDAAGLCVAEAGNEDICAELEIEMAKISKEKDAFEGSVVLASAGTHDVYMRKLDALGNEFYLCAAGGDREHRKQEIERSVAGIERILSS